MRAAHQIAAAVFIVVTVEGGSKQATAQVEAGAVAEHEDMPERTCNSVTFGTVAARGRQCAIGHVRAAEKGRRSDEQVIVLLTHQGIASDHAALVVAVPEDLETGQAVQIDVRRRITTEQAEIEPILLVELKAFCEIEVQADSRREIVGVEAWPR